MLTFLVPSSPGFETSWDIFHDFCKSHDSIGIKAYSLWYRYSFLIVSYRWYRYFWYRIAHHYSQQSFLKLLNQVSDNEVATTVKTLYKYGKS